MKELTLTDIESIGFWKQLYPEFTITDTPFENCTGTEYLCDDVLAYNMKQQVIEDGFFQAPVILDKEDVKQLRQCISKLINHNVMPIFALLYDQYWQALYRLRSMFTSFLGMDYQLVPDFWVWHIANNAESSGWSPHRDGGLEFSSIRDDGTPTLCTVWIALSDVKTTNSCMYLLPRKNDMIFQDFVRRRFGQPGIPGAREKPIPLPNIRALPVEAGALIGWDINVFHWGSSSSRWAEEPRVSIGIYYQASDSTVVPPPFDNEMRRIVDCKTDTVLSFDNRLTILANILCGYLDKFDVDGEKDENLTSVVREFQEKWNRR